MSLNSNLSQFSSILRNGQKAHKLEVSVKKNVKIESILAILREEGFIRDFMTETNQSIKVYLKYNQNKPSITDLTVFSRNNRFNKVTVKQLRSNVNSLRRQNHGLSTFIISTPKGFLTDIKCITNNLGGQLILKIT